MMRPFMDLWSSFAKETTGAAWQSVPMPMNMLNPASYFRDWERRWMDAMSESLETYLRTPQFLEWMRHQSDFIVKSKQQSDNITKEVARNAGIPTANDISGLYERLHSFEDNLIRRLDDELLHRMHGVEDGIGSRLNGDLANRLDRIEETFKSSKSSGDVRRQLDGALDELHSRLDRLENSVASALERIELHLGRADGPPTRSTREAPAANRARSVAPRTTKSPVKSRSSTPSQPNGKGKGKPSRTRSSN
jgi:hypothetical protein